MEDGALTIERRIASRETGLQGPITLTSPDWLGDHVVAPIAGSFGALHPLVTLDLIIDSRLFNLSRRHADIAIGIGSFGQEDQVLSKVAGVNEGHYAWHASMDKRELAKFDVSKRARKERR